jgi:arylsulfatase A-like enzyme
MPYRFFFNKITKVIILTGLVAVWHASICAQKAIHQSNILFIAVDDLKPDLNCYGFSTVLSPNIDALAKSATLFTAAYCQQAVCGPSRTSMLTGLRPDKTKVWDLKTKFRQVNPNIVSLPQYFKSNGYTTIGMGKVFDPSNTDKDGDALSWSTPFTKIFPLAKGYENIAFGIYQSKNIKDMVAADGDEDKDEGQFYGPDKNQAIRFSTECLDVPDDAYMDGAMANDAIVQLKNLANSKEPFFMAVGFKKPHLPFVAPKKYWDLYDRNKIELAAYKQPAEGSPDIAYQNGGELRNYAADIKALNVNKKELGLTLDEAKQKELIHGYYACISYTDAQIGKLLAALKASGLDKNTIIVLWGDHGWHLGDHNMWCKHTNFEQATRIPLMIKAPAVTKGKQCASLVESVDLFPTLCELTGLKSGTYLDGKSLVPALKNNKTIVKEFAISQYPRGAGDGAKEVMGYSIRTKQYRYTEWVNKFTTADVFDISKIKAIELYDYKNDPLETKNIVNDAANRIIVEKLATQLHNYYAQQNKTLTVIN